MTNANQFEVGEPVWVTSAEGITMPTPFAYGPFLEQFMPGCTFSKERPAANWQTVAPYLMADAGLNEVEATLVTKVLLAMNIPCSPENVEAAMGALTPMKLWTRKG